MSALDCSARGIRKEHFGLWLFLALLVLAAVLFAALPCPSIASELNLGISDDAYVSNLSGKADTNYGAEAKLTVGKLRHAYLRLDLSGLEGAESVESATLTLKKSGSARNTLEICEAEEFLTSHGTATESLWTASNVTYNNRPNDVADGWSITSDANLTLAIDVSDLVNRALAAGETAVTVHITTQDVEDTSVAATDYYSSRADDESNRPSFTVSLAETPSYVAGVNDNLYVYSGENAGKNYADATSLIVGKGRHAYIRLCLDGIDPSTLETATLKLMWSKGNTSNRLVICEASEYASSDGQESNSLWSESALTYDTRPLDVADGWSATTDDSKGTLKLDVSELVKSKLSQGVNVVTLHISTEDVDNNNVSATEYYSSRAKVGPKLVITSTGDEDPVELNVTRSLGTNYLDDESIVQKVFRMKDVESGLYVKVNADGGLSGVSQADEASLLGLYVSSTKPYSGDAAQDEDNQEWVKAFGSIRDMESGNYFTIQNYGTTDGQAYYNNDGTNGSDTLVLATASSINWNERFDIVWYPASNTYTVKTHLNLNPSASRPCVIRDEAGYADNLTTVSFDANKGLVALGSDDSDVRFLFEEAAGSYPLEPRARVNGTSAIVSWLSTSEDSETEGWTVSSTSGSVGSVSETNGVYSVEVSNLSTGNATVSVSNGVSTALVNVCVFSHPGVFSDQESLENMIEHVSQEEEPWYSDYLRLKNTVPNGMSSSDYSRAAEEVIGRGDGLPNGVSIEAFEEGGNAAYFNALQWVITGDSAYASTATSLLNDWAATLKMIDGRDRILGAAINSYRYLNAAEILRGYNGGYSGFTNENIASLQTMFLNVVYPVIEDLGSPMYANGNWDTAGMASLIALGVFCDNVEIYARALDLYQSAYVNGSIVNYVADWGQSVESMRDQGHAQLGIGYMADVCQIAENQGDGWLWGLYNNKLAKAFNWAAEYNLYGSDDDESFVAQPLADLFGRTQWTELDEQTIIRGELRPVYESALAHYSTVDGVDTTWIAKAAEAMRPQGYVHNDNLNFGTLTSYVGDSTDTPVPSFLLRTRLEPWYQRTYASVWEYGGTNGDYAVAESLNSYFSVGENGQLTASAQHANAPMFQLVANSDGTYSIRVCATGKYLSVKSTDYDETGRKILAVDAETVGETEKFYWHSLGFNNHYYLQSAAKDYEGRLIECVVEGSSESASTATLRLVLGTQIPLLASSVPNASRFAIMYGVA